MLFGWDCWLCVPVIVCLENYSCELAIGAQLLLITIVVVCVHRQDWQCTSPPLYWCLLCQDAPTAGVRLVLSLKDSWG